MCRRFTVVVLLGVIGILGVCKPVESDPWRARVESGWIGADSDVVGSASLPLGMEGERIVITAALGRGVFESCARVGDLVSGVPGAFVVVRCSHRTWL